MSSSSKGWVPGFRPGAFRLDGSRTGPVIYFAPVQDDLMKRLMWSGLLAALGALASIAANRIAASVWRRVFDEDPPD
jgi:hypothetical protein